MLIGFFFASCGDADTTVYNGDASNQTFLSFSSAVYNFPIEIDATGSLDVILNSTTVQDFDRTFPITIVAEETTADPLTYTLPSSVTIPAGSYQGILHLDGVDNGLEEARVLTITFENTQEGAVLDSNKAIINVKQFCPIEPGKFEGNYRLEQTSAPSGFGPAFDDQTVSIARIGDENSVTRQFSGIYLESAGGSSDLVFTFDLLCGLATINQIGDSGLSCDGETNITIGPSANAGSYDPEDDSEFFVTFTEFVTDGGCGQGPVQTTLKFTKL